MREREGVTNGLCIVLRPQIAFHMVMRCSLQKLQSPLVFWFAGGGGEGSRFPSILGMEQMCFGAPLSSGHQKR